MPEPGEYEAYIKSVEFAANQNEWWSEKRVSLPYGWNNQIFIGLPRQNLINAVLEALRGEFVEDAP